MTPPLLQYVSNLQRLVPWLCYSFAFSASIFVFSERAHAVPPRVNIGNAMNAEDESSSGIFGFLSNWRRTSNLLGNMWGLRSELGKYGATLAIQETSEVMGNLTGGVHRGAAYNGLTQAILQVNTQRAFGWYGGTFNVSMEQIHGRSLSADNLQVFQTASGIEADRSTRLWELWFDQKFFDQQQLDIKIGQQSLDQEYMISNNALTFVNTMFGWPMVPSADLPGGGPAYPLSTLGARAKYWAATPLYILGGIYSGSPSRSWSEDPQKSNRSGTSFPLNRGVMAIIEFQYVYPALGEMVSPDGPQPLSHIYRLGAWYDSEPFADQYYDNTHTPLASSDSNGNPKNHRGAFSLYAVIDQMIWRSRSDVNRTLNIFGRAMGVPQAERVPIDFSMNFGLTLKDPLPYRTDDTFGIGMGYTHVSGALARNDKAVHRYQGTYSPAQGGETFVEVTYQYQFTGWMQWQPDFQYIFNPSGGIPNPIHPNRRIRDELILGFRTNIAL
ncbi:carbohydrate porin [Saccharibacter sp. 17.LH.SD]|uniref:carbohydrate porin n=1 Tax=Saccharibacter sp. 17.LH.SD TaxID=2689393 RepID=UPI00136F8EA4|nr:carbohydrate porin [Saccharibacter sp. 17.LH.SD]MXV44989.1 carbohydrate porin [Saccharibacter sp. 17.LH.SD]